MFWLLRRLIWFGTGASLGFGGAMWLRSRLLRAVERFAPEHVTTEVADNVKRVGTEAGSKVRQATTTVREALDEGRSRARERETALRHELVASGPSAPGRRADGNDQGVAGPHH